MASLLDWSTMLFIDDENTIEHASTEVITLNLYMSDANGMITYIKYNNAAYRIEVDIDYDIPTFITTDVVKVYVPDENSNVGKVVQYSADGTSAATDWLVLYDNGNTLDIMSLNEMGSYTLGIQDPNATGANDLEKARNSYENAVSRLNTYCGTLVTNSTAQKTRCVGTQFDIPDTTEKYSSTLLTNIPTSSPGLYNGVVKAGDINAEQDFVRMSYYSAGGTGSGYSTFGYAATSNGYWLASRYESEISNKAYFYVEYVSENMAFFEGGYLWRVTSDGAEGTSKTCAVRPVVRVAVGNVFGL